MDVEFEKEVKRNIVRKNGYTTSFFHINGLCRIQVDLI